MSVRNLRHTRTFCFCLANTLQRAWWSLLINIGGNQYGFVSNIVLNVSEQTCWSVFLSYCIIPMRNSARPTAVCPNAAVVEAFIHHLHLNHFGDCRLDMHKLLHAYGARSYKCGNDLWEKDTYLLHNTVN